jgi:hypothetical protein
MFTVTLNSANYISSSLADAVGVLRGLCKRYHKLAKDFREQASEDFNNDLVQNNWIHANKAYLTYRNLLKYLKENPKEAPKVLKALAGKTFSSQVQALFEIGIDVEKFSPGEGAHKGLNLWPKMEPAVPSIMPIPNRGTRG